MGNEDAKKMIEMLKQERIFSNEKIKMFLDSKGCLHDKDTLIKIMQVMVSDNQTIWMQFLHEIMLDAATESESFVNLIVEMSNRNLIHPLSRLIDLHKHNSSIATYLYKALDKRKQTVMSLAMGYLLGGLGVEERQQLLSFIDSYASPEPHQQIAFIIGLQIVFYNLQMPDKYANMIIQATHSPERQLRRIAVDTMLRDFSSSPKFIPVLKELAKSADDDTILQISQSCLLLSKSHEKTAFEILKICSKSKNVGVLSSVAMSLGYIASKFPEECLAMVRSWTKIEGYRFGLTYKDYLLEEIGKGDIEKITDFMKNWLSEEQDGLVLLFDFPEILFYIYKSNKQKLLEFFGLLDSRDKRKKALIITTLGKVLSERYSEKDPADSFINESYKLLSKMARRKGLRMKKLTKQIEYPVMKCLAIIDAIENKPKLSIRYVRNNLAQFPTLVDRLGKDWFEKQIKKRNVNHPLIALLSLANIPEKKIRKLLEDYKKETNELRKFLIISAIQGKFYPSALLFRTDTALSLFKRTEQGMHTIIKGLKEEEQFFQTLSELDVGAQLKKRYAVILQHKVGNRPVDVKVSVDGKDYLIEVHSPDMDSRLKYFRKAVFLSNRAKRKILEKIYRQLKYVAADSDFPILIALDKNRASEIDEIEVSDTLEGRTAATILFDKNTGEFMGMHASRIDDSISTQNPSGSIVSGVILIKRDIDIQDGKVKLYGKVFPNKQANHVLDKNVINALEETLFGKSLD